MNSNRMLGLTTKAQAKSTEKLSSGYKINRAADDAAGLSISEKNLQSLVGEGSIQKTLLIECGRALYTVDLTHQLLNLCLVDIRRPQLYPGRG